MRIHFLIFSVMILLLIESWTGFAAEDASRRGTWVWRKDSWVEASARKDLFDFLKRHQIGRIMVQIHTSYESGKPVLKYVPEMISLLKDAQIAGVEVHALDGAPNFIRPPWPEKLVGQIRALAELNASLPEESRFKGVHYDIEPYTLPEFKDPTTRSEVCDEYIACLALLRSAAKAVGLEFSVDVPFWFDTREDLKVVTFGGKTTTLLEHIAEIADWFGIMAYRNRALGSDGIIQHSRGEIAAAAKYGHQAWVGVETGKKSPNDPPKITFQHLTPEDFDRETKQVVDVLGTEKGFGGLLIHSYERYREFLISSSSR